MSAKPIKMSNNHHKATSLIRPPALQAGDKVSVISSARWFNADLLETGLETLRSMKLQPIVGKHVSAPWNQFAGNDQNRAANLQWALDDPEIKAVFCARGGYGSVRIIDQLDFTKFKQHPKWLIGYSDVTVLHSHIHQTCGIETLHATMPVNYTSNSPQAIQTMQDVIFGKALSHEFSAHQFNRKGLGQGQVVGGNLSILYSLMGSVSSLNTDGKILFIEDLDEYLYHIDRMMQNLKRGGLLENLSGLIVGGLTDMHDNDTPFGFTAKEIVRDAVSQYTYPVCFNFPAGHLDDNRALIIGRKATLEIGEQGLLKFDS